MSYTGSWFKDQAAPPQPRIYRVHPPPPRGVACMEVRFLIRLSFVTDTSFDSTASLEWYYYVGPMTGFILLFCAVAVGWYICKRRRSGEQAVERVSEQMPSCV